MSLDTPTVPRSDRRFAAARFAVRVGSQWSPIRVATIWPIADVLSVDGTPSAAEDAAAATEARLVLDLIDSGMIAPPRPRRRRERYVSSRAVFFTAAEA